MVTVANADITGRKAQNDRAHSAYVGKSKRWLKPVNGVDDNLIISLARLVVDKGASFLFGQEVLSQVPDASGERPTTPEDETRRVQGMQRQDWLNECWRRNKRTLTLLKAATNGGIYGHCFIRLLDQLPYPRAVVLDPSIVEVQTNPDDVDDVWKFTITPPPAPQLDDDGYQLARRTLIQNPSGVAGEDVGVAEPWQICDQQYVSGVWVTVETADWPHACCPILHCQNIPKPNDFWGESDLPEDVLEVLDGINRVASNMNKIIRVHAGPKVWSRGMGSRNLDISTDSIIHMPSETAELRILEMQSDLSSSLAFLNKLFDALAMVVRIPLVAMGQPDKLGDTSGVSLQIRYQPLIEKTEAKRLTYGDMLIELDRCLLAMGGFGDTTITNLVWPDILPQDALAELQAMVLEDALGIVSKETLAERRGLNWEQEQKQRQGEITDATVTSPDPVPAPEALAAPKPDIAKTGKSR